MVRGVVPQDFEGPGLRAVSIGSRPLRLRLMVMQTSSSRPTQLTESTGNPSAEVEDEVPGTQDSVVPLSLALQVSVVIRMMYSILRHSPVVRKFDSSSILCLCR